MKVTTIANGVNDKLVLIPESEIEIAFMMALQKNEQHAIVKRGQYTPLDGAQPGPQSAIIITVPHVVDTPGGLAAPKGDG